MANAQEKSKGEEGRRERITPAKPNPSPGSTGSVIDKMIKVMELLERKRKELEEENK
jgi:hypothetical protein